MMVAAFLLTLQTAVPTLDGTITSGEYDGATTLTGSTGMLVHVRTTDEAIYLAVSGAQGGYPHLAIARGDTVLLLHASAALGTARFVGTGSSKRLVQPFVWGVRNAGTGASGVAARDAHFQREGWAATTIEMGTPGITEFKVSRALLPARSPLAIGFWSAPSTIQRWPASLDDEAVAARLVQGFLPATATFAVAEWGRSP